MKNKGSFILRLIMLPIAFPFLFILWMFSTDAYFWHDFVYRFLFWDEYENDIPLKKDMM